MFHPDKGDQESTRERTRALGLQSSVNPGYLYTLFISMLCSTNMSPSEGPQCVLLLFSWNDFF